METRYGVCFKNNRHRLALQEDEPTEPTRQSSLKQKEHYDKWKKSNMLSLIAIQMSVSKHILSGLLEAAIDEALLKKPLVTDTKYLTMQNLNTL